MADRNLGTSKPSSQVPWPVTYSCILTIAGLGWGDGRTGVALIRSAINTLMRPGILVS